MATPKKDGMSTLFIEVPDELHDAIKNLAAETGLTIKSVAAVLLSDALGMTKDVETPEAKVARALGMRQSRHVA
jgi:hypothetical protein